MWVGSLSYEGGDKPCREGGVSLNKRARLCEDLFQRIKNNNTEGGNNQVASSRKTSKRNPPSDGSRDLRLK